MKVDYQIIFAIVLLIMWESAYAQNLPIQNDKIVEENVHHFLIQTPRSNFNNKVNSPKLDNLLQNTPAEFHTLHNIGNTGVYRATVKTDSINPELLDEISNLGAKISKERSYTTQVFDLPELVGLSKLLETQSPPPSPQEGTIDYALVVMDTGVQLDHPFLKGRIVGEACFSQSDPGHGIETLCPEGIEQADGVFVSKGGKTGSACADMLKNCEHGTHVAGIAVGNQIPDPRSQNSSKNINGINAQLKILPIQVFSRFTRPEDCPNKKSPCIKATDVSILQALDYVMQLVATQEHENKPYKIYAINMSFGSGKFENHCDFNNALANTINALRLYGVVTFVATGNNGHRGVSAPACINNVISVAAVTKSNEMWSSSNRHPGDLVDILAPGVGIYSSTLSGGFEQKSGTSMATPAVSAAYMMLKAYHPTRTVDAIEAALTQNTDTIFDAKTNTNYPVLNIKKAHDALATGLPLPLVNNVEPAPKRSFAEATNR